VAHDVLLKRAVQQMVALEVEASPVERRLRGALEEATGVVAEELRHVDGLGPTRRRLRHRRTRAPSRRSAKEVGEELVEEAAAAPEATHSFLREVDLAEVFDFLRPIRTTADPGRDCRSPVTLAKVFDGHLNPPVWSAPLAAGNDSAADCLARHAPHKLSDLRQSGDQPFDPARRGTKAAGG
jgi:hypothetical protein